MKASIVLPMPNYFHMKVHVKSLPFLSTRHNLSRQNSMNGDVMISSGPFILLIYLDLDYPTEINLAKTQPRLKIIGQIRLINGDKKWVLIKSFWLVIQWADILLLFTLWDIPRIGFRAMLIFKLFLDKNGQENGATVKWFQSCRWVEVTLVS